MEAVYVWTCWRINQQTYEHGGNKTSGAEVIQMNKIQLVTIFIVDDSLDYFI